MKPIVFRRKMPLGGIDLVNWVRCKIPRGACRYASHVSRPIRKSKKRSQFLKGLFKNINMQFSRVSEPLPPHSHTFIWLGLPPPPFICIWNKFYIRGCLRKFILLKNILNHIGSHYLLQTVTDCNVIVFP